MYPQSRDGEYSAYQPTGRYSFDDIIRYERFNVGPCDCDAHPYHFHVYGLRVRSPEARQGMLDLHQACTPCLAGVIQRVAPLLDAGFADLTLRQIVAAVGATFACREFSVHDEEAA